MTNSYDVDHGLSQVAPGPLGLEAPDDTLARTGNTARDQEMYAAGIRTGEENAKHNAAIRAGAGWLPIESAPKDSFIFDGLHHYGTKIIVFDGSINTARWWRIEGDSASNFIDEGGRAIYPTHWMPLPAAPGVSTAGNQQPARDWELTCHECDGSGHVYVKHQVAERKTDMQEFKEECECCEGRGFVFAFQDIPGIEEYVKACRPAPAAGDALDAADAVDVDWQLMRETAMLVRDRFSAALSIAYASSDATRSAIRRAHETYEALLAMLDAAIAAQRKGYA